MVELSREWESFWDLTTPAEAAELMRADHGEKALQAAEECAEVALADGRETDQKFWLAVAAELKVKNH